MPEILQGNNTEAKLLADERFLRKIALLYYEDGNSQEAIAEIENCSRQTVGKALQKAKERNIVRITVTPDIRSGYLRNLSRSLRVELGLEDVVLIAGRNINAASSEETLEDVVAPALAKRPALAFVMETAIRSQLAPSLATTGWVWVCPSTSGVVRSVLTSGTGQANVMV